MSESSGRIIAVDPGTYLSGVISLVDGIPDHALCGVMSNEELIDELRRQEGCLLALEMVGHYGKGMPAGKTTFITCCWIGAFIVAWEGPHLVFLRQTIKTFLIGSASGDGPNVRQALIDKYDGEDKAIGGRRCSLCHGKGWRGREHTPCPVWDIPPGPLFGLKSHIWSALAVGRLAYEKPELGRTLYQLTEELRPETEETAHEGNPNETAASDHRL